MHLILRVRFRNTVSVPVRSRSLLVASIQKEPLWEIVEQDVHGQRVLLAMAERIPHFSALPLNRSKRASPRRDYIQSFETQPMGISFVRLGIVKPQVAWMHEGRPKWHVHATPLPTTFNIIALPSRANPEGKYAARRIRMARGSTLEFTR